MTESLDSAEVSQRFKNFVDECIAEGGSFNLEISDPQIFPIDRVDFELEETQNFGQHYWLRLFYQDDLHIQISYGVQYGGHPPEFYCSLHGNEWPDENVEPFVQNVLDALTQAKENHNLAIIVPENPHASERKAVYERLLSLADDIDSRIGDSKKYFDAKFVVDHPEIEAIEVWYEVTGPDDIYLSFTVYSKRYISADMGTLGNSVYRRTETHISLNKQGEVRTYKVVGIIAESGDNHDSLCLEDQPDVVFDADEQLPPHIGQMLCDIEELLPKITAEDKRESWPSIETD
jgi:hypothetical protein